MHGRHLIFHQGPQFKPSCFPSSWGWARSTLIKGIGTQCSPRNRHQLGSHIPLRHQSRGLGTLWSLPFWCLWILGNWTWQRSQNQRFSHWTFYQAKYCQAWCYLLQVVLSMNDIKLLQIRKTDSYLFRDVDNLFAGKSLSFFFPIYCPDKFVEISIGAIFHHDVDMFPFLPIFKLFHFLPGSLELNKILISCRVIS